MIKFLKKKYRLKKILFILYYNVFFREIDWFFGYFILVN